MSNPTPPIPETAPTESSNAAVATAVTPPPSKPLRTLYVFVEISIDVGHLVACVQANFGATPALPLTVGVGVTCAIFTTQLSVLSAVL